MSGFTVHVPTQEEITEGGTNVSHVHMTSDLPWNPYDRTHSSVEGTLHDVTNHGMNLLHQVPRDLSQLQARGQSTVADDEMTVLERGLLLRRLEFIVMKTWSHSRQ